MPTVTRTTNQVTRDNNKKKIKAAFLSKIWNAEPNYSLSFSFDLNANQGINDPIEYLCGCMTEKVVNRLSTGSGLCFMTGLRDFSFEGTKDEMTRILKIFEVSEFRIKRMYISVLEIDPQRKHF